LAQYEGGAGINVDFMGALVVGGKTSGAPAAFSLDRQQVERLYASVQR